MLRTMGAAFLMGIGGYFIGAIWAIVQMLVSTFPTAMIYAAMNKKLGKILMPIIYIPLACVFPFFVAYVIHFYLGHYSHRWILWIVGFVLSGVPVWMNAKDINRLRYEAGLDPDHPSNENWDFVSFQASAVAISVFTTEATFLVAAFWPSIYRFIPYLES